jgi:hypothetical protein
MIRRIALVRRLILGNLSKVGVAELDGIIGGSVMKFKSAIVLLIVCILFPSTTRAQGGFTFDQPTHRLEIIPMGGYVWTVSKSAVYGGFSGDVDIKNSEFYGLALDISAKPGVQARLLYRRQDSDLTFKSPVRSESEGIGVEYWHVGGVVGMARDNIKPYSSFTLGGTRYIIDGEDEWKFSILLSLGVKIFINERIGLMVAGQMPLIITDGFVGVGTGGLSLGGTGVVQLDVVGGLIIAL